YLVNVATTTNKIRIPSRKIISEHAAAAAALGARGLIVHAGHVNTGDDPEQGFLNWRKALERTEHPLPILIEHTAGGDNEMGRRPDERGAARGRGRAGRRHHAPALPPPPGMTAAPARTSRITTA